MIDALAVLLGAGVLGAFVVARIRGADPDPALESGLVRLTIVALALALASTVVTASMLAPPSAAGGPNRVIPLAFVALVAALVVVGRRPRASPLAVVPRADATASRSLRLVLAIACVAASYVVIEHFVRRPDGEWDAFGFWNLRARLMHRATGDAETIFSTEMPYSHPDYPLLLPGLVATGWSIAREGATWVTAVIAFLFGALAAGALFTAISPRRGRTAATLAVLVYLASPHVLREVAWRYADIPLSAFFVLSCGWLASAHARPARATSSLALAGLSASLGAWTKNEGTVHVLVLGLVLLANPPTSVSRWRALRAYVGAALPFLLVLAVFKVGLAPVNDIVAGADGASVLARITDRSRYATIVGHLVHELGRWSHWCYLLPVAVFIAIFGPRRDGTARPVGAAVGLVVAAYLAVYVVTPQPLSWHLTHSFDRLLLQVYPSILLIAALRLPRMPGAAAPPPPAPLPSVPEARSR